MAEILRSRSNPLVRRLRELARGDRASGLMLIEGVRLAEEALAAGVEIVEAAALTELGETVRGAALAEALARREVPIRGVDRGVLESLSDVESSQGILLIARRPPPSDDAPPTGALALVLAGVQNPGNVGGLLRTAEGAGVARVFVGEGTADPFAPKALRGAMGSAFRIPLHEVKTAVAVERLRNAGAVVWAAAEGGTRYDAVDWRRPSALVVGNEGAGLPNDVVTACNGRVTVPMAGRVESLNVGVAAGVILFEAARQRRG
jgi:TrmH family RNA methyltransferase